MGGAEVNSKENYGQTPLIKAVNRGHESTEELLLKGGADELEDWYGLRTLFLIGL
jgi:ankyrin repeat protein